MGKSGRFRFRASTVKIARDTQTSAKPTHLTAGIGSPKTKKPIEN